MARQDPRPEPRRAKGGSMNDVLSLIMQTLSQDIEQHRALIAALTFPWFLVLFLVAHRHEGRSTYAPEEE